MTEMSRLRSASLDMTGLRLYCPPTYNTPIEGVMQILIGLSPENRSSGPPFGKQATPPAPRPKGVREASSKKLPGAGI
jgi:hypothetical protein